MKRLFLFLTVAAAVCCAACSDDPEVAESNLSLLEDNVTFDMFGGRSVLEITADSPWTVSCDDDWCRTNVAEGSHTKKIVLTSTRVSSPRSARPRCVFTPRAKRSTP